MTTTTTSTTTVEHVWLKLDTGGHTEPVAALAASVDARRLVSASDCTVRVWDATTQQPLRMILGHTGPRVEGGSAADTIDRLALSPDGQWLVTVKSGRRLEVFTVERGNLVAAVEDLGQVDSLAFSPDGRWLAVGGSVRDGPRHRRGLVRVYAAAAWRRAGLERAPVPVAELRVARTRMVDEVAHLAVHLRWRDAAWSPGDGPWPGLVVAVQSLSEPRVDALLWLTRGRTGDWRQRHARPLPDGSEAATLAVAAGGVVLSGPSEPCAYDPERRLGRLLVFDHHGRALGERIVEQEPAAIAVSPDGHALAVGCRSHAQEDGADVALVHVFDWAVADIPQLRSSYYGHDADVRAVTWLGPDRVASSGGDHHAIHLWQPTSRVGRFDAALRGLGQVLRLAAIDAQDQLRFGSVPLRLRPLHHPSRQQRFDLPALQLNTVCPSEPDPVEGEDARWLLGGCEAQVLQLYHRPETEGWEPQLGRPGHLTLYIGADDEWVLWTRSGYVVTHPPGSRRFGYCIDRGPRQEALFLPADRFRSVEREDIVRAVVAHGSEARARAQGVEIPPLDIVSQLPPLLELISARVRPGGRDVRLRFSVQHLSPGQPLQRLWILRQERFVWFEDRPRALRRRLWQVDLPLNSGPNRFSIHADSGTTKAEPCAVEVEGPPALDAGTAAGTRPGRLFLLSVGVSNFAVAGTDQAAGTHALRFPHRDAMAVEAALAGPRPREARTTRMTTTHNAAFDAVVSTLLIDRQATKAAILERLRDYAWRIEQRERERSADRDVLMVYLSGHGTRFRGEPEFYFWNWDLVPTKDDMARTGLSLVEFAEIATAVPAEVVLVIDACHSGMAGSNLMMGLDPQEVARRIQSIHERGMYIINASRAEELSFEATALGHSVLTKVLLDALQVPAGVPPAQRRVLMMDLVTAAQKRVPLLGQQLGAPQTPVSRMYGDLEALVIFEPHRASSAPGPLRHAGPSAIVDRRMRAPTPRRNRTMATAKKAPAKKAPAKKTAAKAAPAKKAAAPAKKAPAKKAAAPAKKAPAKKAAAPAKKAAPAPKAAPAKKAPAKKAAPAAKKVPARKPAAKKAVARKSAAPAPATTSNGVDPKEGVEVVR